MSKSVVIICVLMCIAGLLFGFPLFSLVASGAYESLPGQIVAVLSFAGFVLFPAGMLLMLGHKAGRTLCVVPLFAGYLTSAAMVFSPLIPGFEVTGVIQGYSISLTMALLLLGVTLLLHWQICSAAFDDHLSSGRP